MFDGCRMFRAGSAILGFAIVLGACFGGTLAARAQDKNSQIEADVHKALASKKFENITVSVRDANVMLTGTVALYADKEDADRRVHHVQRVRGVDNEIQVAGSSMSDAALRDKLAKALTYDRIGYGTMAFNDITISVRNGVVTLGGMVYGPPDKDSALSLVGNTPGVRDVVDNLQVAPVSPMDDGLRQRLAQAIYGSPQLQKYAINPAKPIRITVVNGNVTLSGVVDSKMDRDIAGIRANIVPGVFKVVNDIQVAGSQSGK